MFLERRTNRYRSSIFFSPLQLITIRNYCDLPCLSKVLAIFACSALQDTDLRHVGREETRPSMPGARKKLNAGPSYHHSHFHSHEHKPQALVNQEDDHANVVQAGPACRERAASETTQPPHDRPDRLTTERGAAQALSKAETRPKEVWDQVIPQGMFESTRDSDFFLVDGTSLLLVELQARIRQRFDCNLRLADLFTNSMFCTMSKLISQESATSPTAGDDGKTSSMEIDWEWETQPAPELRIGTADLSIVTPPSPNPKSVVITGGAGFLGRSLLESAIENPHIARVHAVAVRKLQQRLASGLLPQHPKVIYYGGVADEQVRLWRSRVTCLG
ncbi:hypothetical protein LX32DRAFT_685566 [Colletotrichum zoysiae]|uniref:Carrier domain-containing protein n=1 Tax=Colletotrichum zoysiae TaxID=1216348 RepID=A0AAD9M0R1_9PEZI|nr:hypothetical protein LX32DRAFT_685566 [Colletotrichum zoysiae]